MPCIKQQIIRKVLEEGDGLKKPVLVTGATGYIAGVLIQQLLELGLTVHGTVRDPSRKDKVQYLYDVAEQQSKSGGTLKLFAADLLNDGSFDTAAKDCSIIFHTASPFAMKVSNPQKDLVDPAVKGTMNVLQTANRTSTVTRVVVTSSEAAICGDAIELKDTPNHIFTEEIWNRSSTIKNNPYYYSKCLAEQKAWVMAGSQIQWKLVVLNPTLVMGPGLRYVPTSQSYKLFIELTGGDMKSGAPNLPFGVVDVRDVATAHIAAAFLEETSGRYILCGSDSSFPEMTQTLANRYPSHKKIPTKPLRVPKLIITALAPYVSPLTRSHMWRNLNYKKKFDTTKSRQELGIEYYPLSETMQDMYEQLLDMKIIQP